MSFSNFHLSFTSVWERKSEEDQTRSGTLLCEVWSTKSSPPNRADEKVSGISGRSKVIDGLIFFYSICYHFNQDFREWFTLGPAVNTCIQKYCHDRRLDPW